MGIKKNGQEEFIEQDLTQVENGVLGQCLYLSDKERNQQSILRMNSQKCKRSRM